MKIINENNKLRKTEDLRHEKISGSSINRGISSKYIQL